MTWGIQKYLNCLELVCKLGCPVAVFAGGIPKKSDIEKAKMCGAKVICFTPTAPLAHKLIERGADSLMLEGSEAVQPKWSAANCLNSPAITRLSASPICLK
jgi:hypothetical protein